LLQLARLTRRRSYLAAAVALAMAASLLGACNRAGSGSSGCPGAGGAGGLVADANDPAGTGSPPDVAEALWVADSSGTLRAFDGRTNQVTAQVDIGRTTAGTVPALLAGGGLIWVYRFDTGEVELVDPGLAKVTKRAAISVVRPFGGNRLRYAHSALWVAQPDRLWRVSPTGVVTSAKLPVGFAPSTVTATAHWLWLTDGSQLVRIDPTSMAAQAGVPSGVGDIRQLLGSAAGLFAVGTNKSEVRVLDADTGVPRSSVQIPGHESVVSMLDVDGQIWATGSCGDVLQVTDPRVPFTNVSKVSQDLPAAVALGSLWVGDEVHSEVVRLSLRSGRILARIPFVAADPDDPAFEIVTGQHSVWVVDANLADGVSRVDPTANRIKRLLPTTSGSAGLAAVVSSLPQQAPAPVVTTPSRSASPTARPRRSTSR
jgi:hypothetical protein